MANFFDKFDKFIGIDKLIKRQKPTVAEALIALNRGVGTNNERELAKNVIAVGFKPEEIEGISVEDDKKWLQVSGILDRRHLARITTYNLNNKKPAWQLFAGNRDNSPFNVSTDGLAELVVTLNNLSIDVKHFEGKLIALHAYTSDQITEDSLKDVGIDFHDADSGKWEFGAKRFVDHNDRNSQMVIDYMNGRLGKIYPGVTMSSLVSGCKTPSDALKFFNDNNIY